MAERAVELIGGSVTDKTKKNYENAVAKFEFFRSLSGIRKRDCRPPSDSTITCWIAWLSGEDQKLGLQTIRTYLSGLTKKMHWRGYLSTSESLAVRPLTKQCLEGLERQLARRPSNDKQKLAREPLSFAMLEQVQASLPLPDQRSYTERMMFAAMTLTLAGGFRAGEIFPCEGQKGLSFSCLTPLNESLNRVEPANASLYKVRLITSKAKQKEAVEIPIAIPLAVKAVTDYLSVRPPSSPSSPLFLTQAGLPLARTSFVSSTRIYLSRAGVNGVSKIYGHSFRLGMAQELRDAGHDDTTIKRYGRWKSTAHLRYHKDSLRTLADVGRSVKK